MEITVKDFFMLMIKKLPFLILGAVIGFAAFFGYTKMTEVPKYSCEVTMIVNAAPNTIATSGTIQASQNLTKAYIAIMKDFSFSEKIKAELPESCTYTVSQIRRAISMSAVDESQILAVNVVAKSAQDSYNIAKVIEEIAPQTLRQYFDDTGSIVILRSAEKPMNPNASSLKLNSVLGAMIGLILSASIVFLIAKLDKRIRTEEEIVSIAHYPVLGSIRRVM